MPSNRRRTVAIVVGVVVVICVIGGIALLAGRSEVASKTSPPSPSSPVTSSSTPSPQPTYSPTNQQGSPEPALAQGMAAAGQGGRSTGADGLPLGYSHDQPGAIAAATNYLMWMNSIRITDAPAAVAMATASAADAATRAALIQSFDETRSGMKSLTADQIEPARGAYAVPSYSPTAATVYIWAPEVTTDSTGAVDQVWAIDAVNVVWTSGDWKLNRTLIAQTGGAAVDPVDPAGNPTAAEKHAILLRNPADPGEIQNSAEQTWFEYRNAPH